jgi:hypothetical protein
MPCEPSPSPAAAGRKGSGAHMRTPFQRWPHQHKPSALMMQVPEPQQRVSSMVGLSKEIVES